MSWLVITSISNIPAAHLNIYFILNPRVQAIDGIPHILHAQLHGYEGMHENNSEHVVLNNGMGANPWEQFHTCCLKQLHG